MGADAREAWHGTVSRVVDDCETVVEAELVIITRDGDGPPTIELTDGTRIECVERAA